jgi:enhanced entry protein EnhC
MDACAVSGLTLWYKKSADLGNREANYQLGLLSETGVGLPLNYANAIKYYQQAADLGDEKAIKYNS